MNQLDASTQSLFARQSGQGSSTSQRKQVEQAVEKFEGLLWDQVAQAMTSVKLGPSNLGYAGHAYQHMLWRRIASRDFNNSDMALTRSTLEQLMPHIAQTQPRATHGINASPKAASTQPSAPNSPDQWVRHIWHAITSGAKALKVPARALLAQAALETGWGRNAQGNNIFGIKAHGGGASFKAMTHEFSGGVFKPVKAAFKSYRSVTHAVDDLVNVVKQVHPQAMGHTTVAGFARALQHSGYATDPRYAAKIEAVAHSPLMRNLLDGVKK